MENTFESAKDYIAQLDAINANWHLDKDTIASALMSYSEKTNSPTKKTLQDFAEKFREWQRQWELFDKRLLTKKPKHIDEFIGELFVNV